MGMRGSIEIAQRASRLRPDNSGLQINSDLPHHRKIDDHSIVAEGPTSNVVTAAADRDQDMVRPSKVDRLSDIAGIRTADDQARVSLDARVPYSSSRFVFFLFGEDRPT